MKTIIVLLGVFSGMLGLIDGHAAYKELNEIRRKMTDEMIQSRKLDLKAVDEAVRKKAVEFTTDVTADQISDEQAGYWASVFHEAGKLDVAQSLAERYVQSAEPGDETLRVQVELAKIYFEQGNAEALHETLSAVEPSSFFLITLAMHTSRNYAPLLSEKLGPDVAIQHITRLQKLLKEQDDERLARFIKSRETDLVCAHARTLAQAGKLDEALALVNQVLADTDDAKTKTLLNGLIGQLKISQATPPSIAPDFQIGEFSSLDDLKGRVVVLDFFAHWCGPCKASFPDMKAMYQDLHDDGLEIIGVTGFYGFYESEKDVSKEDEYKKMQGFMKQHDLPWSLLFASREEMKAYGVASIPHVVVIGRDGLVHKIKIGYSAAEFGAFRADIEKLLHE